MIFRRFCLFLAVVALAGCSNLAAYRYHQTYLMVQPVESGSGEYEDTGMFFRIIVRNKRIFVTFKNKTGSDAVILWSRARFVDPEGLSSKVANRQSLFTDDMDHTDDEILPPGEFRQNIIVPVNNVEKMDEPWVWSIRPLFEMEDDKALLNRGKTFAVVLPMMVGGEQRSYRFEFTVASVVPHTFQTPR